MLLGMENSPIREFVNDCGGLAEFSRLAGIPKTTVHSWITRGNVPYWRRPLLEKVSKSRKIKIPDGLADEAKGK